MAVRIEVKGNWCGVVSDDWRPALGEPDASTFAHMDVAAAVLALLAGRAEGSTHVIFRLVDTETDETRQLAPSLEPPVRD